MKAACPQCGADVEFRFDDTFVRVCDHCRAAVVRGDRGLETLGEFADLAETDSRLALFATGAYQGKPFQLVGRAQLKHKAGGRWDEWYAKFDDGRWGWLSEAQGRFYMMFAVDVGDAVVPPRYQLSVGAATTVPGVGEVKAAEIAAATYVAAAGEIPFRLAPGTSYEYADLSGAGGVFATIDYSDQPPSVYAGENVPLVSLGIAGGVEPTPTTAARASRLACPNCDGSIELRAPDQTLRVGCPYCGAMLDASQGQLSVLMRIVGEKAAHPDIPLGSKGTFEGRELTVIGWMERAALIDGMEYSFEEFLLYAPELGFRWLVRSDGSWSYVQPVDVGEVSADVGSGVRYGGVTFRRFQSAPLKVQRVVGEMYWKVAVGDTATGIDYIAPPAMLSQEAGDGEVNWSLGSYRTIDQIEAAFGGAVHLSGSELGVAPNAPPVLRGFWPLYGIAAFALIIGACVVSATASSTTVKTLTCDNSSTPPTPSDPAAPKPPPGSAVCFSEPFGLDGGKNLEIDLRGDASNSWIAVGGDVVNEATGDVESFDRDIEYYSGVDDGESWSEGTNSEHVFLDPMPEGRYVLRLELQSSKPSYNVSATVQQGVFHFGAWWPLALIVLVPGLLFGLIAWSHERKRWRDSDSAPPIYRSGGSDD